MKRGSGEATLSLRSNAATMTSRPVQNPMLTPPSTGMIEPVMNLAAGEAR